ncbi:MAG: hypothetical protein ACT4N4_18025 [Rhodospirillales bacterium]
MMKNRGLCAAGLMAAALWAMPAGAQAPPPASPELGAFAARELAAGRHEGALKAATDRLRAARRDGRAAFVRAAAMTRLGQGAEAARAFEAYARAGGKHRELDREWGLALLAANRPADAKAKFESFLGANPDRADVNLLIGHAAIEASQYDAAAAALKAAYAVEALRPRALALWIALEEQRGRGIAANWRLMELLERHPRSFEAVVFDAMLKRRLPVSMQPETK